MNTSPKEVTVLLVEDNDIDAEAVERGFRKHRIANQIRRAVDGLEAFELLSQENTTNPIARPFLILLDINLPRMNGIEFLKKLRDDHDLRNSIVFVLTTSDNDRDKINAYRLNVAGYILKSNVGEGFVNLVNMLDHYWKIVELPMISGAHELDTEM